MASTSGKYKVQVVQGQGSSTSESSWPSDASSYYQSEASYSNVSSHSVLIDEDHSKRVIRSYDFREIFSV